MAATWKPVDAEIWACSLAFEEYTANRPILGETKAINAVEGDRLLSLWYGCVIAPLMKTSVGFYPSHCRCSTANLGLALECMSV
jgi:hypothetical protein